MPPTRVTIDFDEELTWMEDEAAYAEYERTGEAIPIAAIERWVRSWGTENEQQPPPVG
jgi:hypothetical protein